MTDAKHQVAIGASGRAFTIVEAVMVVFIIGVVAAIALPRYAAFTAQRKVEAAARRIVADLSLARRHARSSSAAQTVDFDIADDFYELVGMADPDHPGEGYRVELRGDPYSADLDSATFDTGNQIVFDGYGNPDSGGTVVVKVGSREKTIAIDPDTGRATVSP